MLTKDFVYPMKEIQTPDAKLTDDELVALVQVLEENLKDLFEELEIPSIVCSKARHIESLQKHYEFWKL